MGCALWSIGGAPWRGSGLFGNHLQVRHVHDETTGRRRLRPAGDKMVAVSVGVIVERIARIIIHDLQIRADHRKLSKPQGIAVEIHIVGSN